MRFNAPVLGPVCDTLFVGKSQGSGIIGMVNQGNHHATHGSNGSTEEMQNQSHSKRPNTQVHRSGRQHGNSDISKDREGPNGGNVG